MNFTPAGQNGLVDCFLLVKTVEKKTSAKGDTYLDMMLSDKSGDINAKIWAYVPAVHGEYAAGDIVKIRGSVSSYNGADQIRIEKIRIATALDGLNPADFVASAEYDSEKMFAELFDIAEAFEDLDLRAIVTTLLSENKE